ncbi:uncharacterized protein SPPG_06688 [Spizellomyces punctatus DAOM BR117]|uniref:U2A'/phosphoprotein 32 family A C-terminal domain-containing protein n=1 Tax=Spizellomyces punctatus (strain DAOM BR117) TaxID=645134 RepID=A0A0L0HAT1_SPIPD|nr:uncharacterized protein SPPG_06688 [Spizellomyces punctatus DAOM BR117]KNC98292.1 hypothetical protein SPPG_06688 [Spizellomyces punctatus DAOM BR117]|eukprot:XP_016606332.1 hypothetical protein SPPG_06688 [Spizellomyces punctatus DAOM BR117]
MQNIKARSGQRETRTKATFAATKKTGAGPEEDTPTVRQRLSEARKTGVLDLRGLNLGNIPVDAEKLQNLSALLLGENRLTSIPADLPSIFPRLTYLDLSFNKIQSVPNVLVDLQDLEVLDLEGNQDIPSQLPTAFRPLVEKGKLAVLRGEPDFSPSDVLNEESFAAESEVEEVQEEGKPEPAWRKDYYDTDDEADHEEGGYEDDIEDQDSLDNKDTRSVTSIDSNLSDGLSTDNLRVEFKLFIHRVEDLEEGDTLEARFRRRWGTGDPVFVRYISKRYRAEAGKPATHGLAGGRRKDRKNREGESRDSEVDDDHDRGSASEEEERPLKGRNAKRQVEYARKEKERSVKQGVKAGRKTKQSMMEVE